MSAEWASVLLTILIAVLSAIATVIGGVTLFFQRWFIVWLQEQTEKQIHPYREKQGKIEAAFLQKHTRLKTIASREIRNIKTETAELELTIRQVAKDHWKTNIELRQLLGWASKQTSDRAYPYTPSDFATKNFDDYWKETRLDLGKEPLDPFASTPGQHQD